MWRVNIYIDPLIQKLNFMQTYGSCREFIFHAQVIVLLVKFIKRRLYARKENQFG
jgi:hypothetical protein